MSLENRVRSLERVSEVKGIIREPDVTSDEVLVKLGFNPDELRAEREETGKSVLGIVATRLGMTDREFTGALKARMRGER